MASALAGLEIVLSGGTGGLGLASAQRLAAEGARLVLGYRSRRERAEEHSALGVVVQADIGDALGRQALLDAAPKLFGLVVFSGEAVRMKSHAEFEDALRRSQDMNFTGPILLAREAAQRMRASGTQGAIVLVSTMQATGLFANSIAYASPKAALIHAGRVLAKENRGKTNIRINTICPGANQAGMAIDSIQSGKYDKYLEGDAIPRWGKADDVAKLVRYLLEPDNYVTGQVITIDGGLTL